MVSTSKDIEVLQLLLLIVAVAALKKPQLADDVRYLQIIPTEGGELVSLTAEEADTLHDVHPLPCVNDCLGQRFFFFLLNSMVGRPH